MRGPPCQALPLGIPLSTALCNNTLAVLPLWHWQVVSGVEPTWLRLPKLRLICSSVACPQFCAALIEQNETVTVRGWIFFIFYETFFNFLNLPTSYHWHKGSKNHQKAQFSNTADFYNWQAVLSQNFSSFFSSPSSSDDSSLFPSASPASSAALLPFWRRRRRLRDLRNTSNASASKMWSRSCDLVQFTPCGQKPKPWKAKEEQTLQPWKFQQAMNFHLTVTLELLMIAVDWVRYTKSISGLPDGGVTDMQKIIAETNIPRIMVLDNLNFSKFSRTINFTCYVYVCNCCNNISTDNDFGACNRETRVIRPPPSSSCFSNAV